MGAQLLLGGQSPKSIQFLETRACKNHYPVVKGYFRFKKLSTNC